MYHNHWFRLRYELTRDYPGRMADVGDVLDAYEFEGNVTLDKYKSINPNHFKDHFRKLRWWEHRTIEQLLTIKYAKVISGTNYYGVGDIVEVENMFFNNVKYVGGKNSILFDLKGHHFLASQIEPATKKEHDEFWEKEKQKIK